MADFEPPSFSLGPDFDLLDSDPHISTASKADKAPSTSNQFSVAVTILLDDDDDSETPTLVDSDSENQVSYRKLKRLQRGSTVEDTVSSDSAKSKVDLHYPVVDDDEIGDFTSQEDNLTDEYLSTQHHSLCRSSKFPLSGHRNLSEKSGNRKQNVSKAPESVITSCNNPPFPKLSDSPLTRVQLIDSDSDFDDPYISEGASKKTYNGSESHLNRGRPDLVKHVSLNEQSELTELIKTSSKKHLWGDVPTPALDEVCKEHFSSMKDKRVPQSNVGKNNQNIHVTNSVTDLGDPHPPAHQYFFHNEPRVQDLVRTRLPNFFPVNAGNRYSEQCTASNIDYMGQFRCGENSKQAARTNKAETSSRKYSRISKIQEASQGFINSNSKLNTQKRVPTYAGKRRVQADGQPVCAGVGHWLTNQDGKRAYVSKNGQELTRRAAYTLYKKETGAGFKYKKAKNTFTKQK